MWQEEKKKKKMESAIQHERVQAVWHAQQLHDGAHASHLRSHNVAPVPRIPGSSVLDGAQQPQQPQTADDVLLTFCSFLCKMYKVLFKNMIFIFKKLREHTKTLTVICV